MAFSSDDGTEYQAGSVEFVDTVHWRVHEASVDDWVLKRIDSSWDVYNAKDFARQFRET